MRLNGAIFLGSVATLALFAEPALAKNSDAQKATEKSTSSSSGCNAYQMAQDGTWTPAPCQESGSAQPQTSATHTDEATH